MIKIILVVLILLLIGGYFFYGDFINFKDEKVESLNKKIDYSCEQDSDCYLTVPSKILECLPCDPLGCETYDSSDFRVKAISKNWNVDCPESEGELCIACISEIKGDHITKCINNRCEKLLE